MTANLNHGDPIHTCDQTLIRPLIGPIVFVLVFQMIQGVVGDQMAFIEVAEDLGLTLCPKGLTRENTVKIFSFHMT